MTTDISTIVQRFMQHSNDAILSLCLNNHNYSQDEENNYDNTQENTRKTYQHLEEHLQTCQTQLETRLEKQIAEQMTIILAIYTDEAILTSGLYSSGYLWPKLHKVYLSNNDGGNIFFQYCDELLALTDSEAPEVLYEFLLYCLENGFKGRYYGNRQALSYYNRQLSQKLQTQDKPKAYPVIRAFHEYA